MPLKFILKHSTVETSVPPNDYLILGELALNCADGIIYFKNGIGTISSLGGKATTTKYGITRLANSNTYDITTAKYITDSDLTDVITIDSLPIKLYENGAWGAFSLPPSVTDAKFGAYSLNLQSAYKRINSNDFNTGDYSVLVGVSNQGIGATSSLIVGNSNTSTATHNTVVGVQNTVGSNYSSAIGYANSIASGQESSTAIGIHGYVNASRSTAIGLNVQISTNDTLEFGYWSDPGSVRNGSLRVIKDGSVSWTVRKSDTSYSVGGTDGTETAAQLMKSGLAFRVAANGNNLIADYCDNNAIRNFKILNEADVINITSLELERTPYFIAANVGTRTLTIDNNIVLSSDRAFTGIGTGLTLLNATNISTGTLAYARFGVDNLVGLNSVAVGFKNNNRAYTGIVAITATLGDSASAIGYMNNTLGARSVALGYANITFASDSTAVGVNNNYAYNTSGGTKTLVSNGQNSTAVGYKNFALSNYAVAIGTLNNTPTPEDSNPTLAGTYSLAVGYKNLAAATYSGAIGTLNSVTVNSDRSSAYGYSNTVAAKYSVALGISNIIASTATNLALSSHYNNSFGIGLENQVYIRDSYALGRLNKIGVGDTGNPNISISSTNAKEILAIGYSNTISTGVNIIAIGSSNTISDGTDIIVLGRNNTTLGQCNYIVGDNNTTYYKTATNLPDGTTAAGVSVTHTSDLSTIHGKGNCIYSDNQPGDLIDGTGIIVGNQNTIHSFFTYTSSRYVSIINSCNTIVTALNSAFTTFKNATTAYINNNSITYTGGVGGVSNYNANVLTADTAISSFNGTNKTLSGGVNIYNAIYVILNNSSVNQGANSTAATAVKTALSTAVGVFRDGSSTAYGYVYWVNALITLYTNAGHVTNSGKINTLSSIVGYNNKVGLSDGYAYKLPATLSANVYSIPDSSNNILSFPAGGRSIASGYANSVFGSNSSAFGSENAVAYNESIALGFKNSSLALRSITFGNNNLTYGLDSMAIGGYNRAQGRRSLSFGYYNNVMIGSGGSLTNTVSGDYSSAIGHNNFALGNYSVALGTNNIVSSKNKTQLHYSEYDETFASMGIGYGNTVNKNYAVAIGTNITIQHPFVTEIGYWSSTTSRIAAMRIGCSTGSVNGSTINTPSADDGVTISGVTGTYIASEVNRRTHNASHTAVVPLVNWTVSRTDTAYTSAAALENENGSSLMMSGLAFRMTTDNQLYADYNNNGSTLSMNLSENLGVANINIGLANHGIVIGLATGLELAASKTTIQNNLTVGGVISGNGSGLTNLIISQLTGILPVANLPANILYDTSDISIAKLTGAASAVIADSLLPTTIVRTTGLTLSTAINNLANGSIPLAKLVGGGVVSSPIDLSANTIIIGTTTSPINTTTSILNNLSVAGNFSAIGNVSVTGNVSATKFSGDGSLLTNLNATNIASGTLNILRLPTIGFSNITGSIAVGQIVDGSITAAKLAAGITTSADGLLIHGIVIGLATSLNLATSKTTIQNNLTVGGNLSVSNTGVITGNGSGLTTLNATNLSSGTVALERLPTNIPLSKINFGETVTPTITTFAQLKNALQIPASSGTYDTQLNGITEIKFAYDTSTADTTYSTLIGADNKYLNNNGDGNTDIPIVTGNFQNCTIVGNKNLLHTGNASSGSSVNYGTIKNTLLLGNHNTSHGDSCAIGHQNQIGGSGTANLESGQDLPHQVTSIGYEKGVDGFHNHVHTVLAKGSIVVGSNNVALQNNAILIGRNNIIHRQGDGLLGTLDGSGSINGLTIGNGNKILSTGTFRNASAITVGHQNTIYNIGDKAIAIGCNNNIGSPSGNDPAIESIFAAGISNSVIGTNSVAIGINTVVGVVGDQNSYDTVVNNVMEIGLWESPNQVAGNGAAIRISGGNVGSGGSVASGCINFSVEQRTSRYDAPENTSVTRGQLPNRTMMRNSIAFRINAGNIAIDYCNNSGVVKSLELGAFAD